jgi:hypothetical protein
MRPMPFARGDIKESSCGLLAGASGTATVTIAFTLDDGVVNAAGGASFFILLAVET